MSEMITELENEIAELAGIWEKGQENAKAYEQQARTIREGMNQAKERLALKRRELTAERNSMAQEEAAKSAEESARVCKTSADQVNAMGLEMAQILVMAKQLIEKLENSVSTQKDG